MNDEDKTKEQLIMELSAARQRIKELELGRPYLIRTFTDLDSRPLFVAANLATDAASDPQITGDKPVHYQFSDLVDIACLEQLLAFLYEITGIPNSIDDMQQNTLTCSGWQDICTKFHRSCPQSAVRCRQSQFNKFDQMQNGSYVGYKCLNGLMDYGSPIIVEGRHLATIILGQFFHEPPDEDYFRHQAQEYGFDEDLYIEALHRVPIISKNRVKPIMEFCSTLAYFLAIMGLERMQLQLADQAVIAQEERLRLVLDASTDGFWDWNIPKGSLYCSPRWAEILGCPPEEIGSWIIPNWTKILHPDDVSFMMNALEGHLLGKTPKYEVEYRLCDRSGTWKWILDRGQVVERNNKGAALRLVGTSFDISERKQAELAIREWEQRMVDIINFLPDPTFVIDTQGNVIAWNNAIEKMTGIKVEDMEGKGNYEYGIPFYGERQPILIDLVHLLHNEKKGVNAEIQCHNGHLSQENFCPRVGENGAFLYGTASLLYDTQGNPVGAIESIRDITRSKEIEKALKESEEKFSRAFLSNPDPLTISTLEGGRYVEVNDAFLECSGYTREEVIGRTISSLNIFADPEKRNLIIDILLEQGLVRGLETIFRTKSGEIRTMLLSAEIMDMGGKSYILSVSKDISDRKDMEESLRLSEERFSKAFNASPVAMSITTFEGNRFIDVNDSFCRVVGYNQQEILGLTVLESGIWGNPDDRSKVKQMIVNNEPIRDLEFHCLTKDQRQRVVLYSAERICLNGEACLLSIITDITERKLMEKEMSRLERLSLVGEMAAGIGHEIRNPMTTIRGFLQMLMENKSYEKDNAYFALMIEELDRANTIISEYLSMARNKKVDLKLRHLNSVVETLYPMIRADANYSDIEVKLDLGLAARSLIDEGEIRQLILNLAHNGIEAMSPGGTLTIGTYADDEVVLYIQDQGHGIEPSLLEKVGTPFFTTKENGTGLGLAVCYSIAVRHNARINIETSLKGTTFKVSFPRAEEQIPLC